MSLRACDSVSATFMLCAGSACASDSRRAVRVRKSHDRVALESHRASRKSRGRREREAPCTRLSNDCACISLTTERCTVSLRGVGSSGGRGRVRPHLKALLCELPYLCRVCVTRVECRGAR